MKAEGFPPPPLIQVFLNECGHFSSTFSSPFLLLCSVSNKFCEISTFGGQVLKLICRFFKTNYKATLLRTHMATTAQEIGKVRQCRARVFSSVANILNCCQLSKIKFSLILLTLRAEKKRKRNIL